MREPFILNVAEAPAFRHPAAGAVVMFERLDQPFPEVGINIRILRAGESNAYYHSENQQRSRCRVRGPAGCLGAHPTAVAAGFRVTS